MADLGQIQPHMEIFGADGVRLGARSSAAPDDLGCWSDAANDLEDALDEVFTSEPRN
ncbi:MAG: hypothetical protein ABIW83_00460 [Allosphingosinicella sp.]